MDVKFQESNKFPPKSNLSFGVDITLYDVTCRSKDYRLYITIFDVDSCY